MDTKKKKPFSPLSYTRVRVFIFFYPETECYHNKILFNNIIVLRKQMLIFISGRIELITAVRSYTVLTNALPIFSRLRVSFVNLDIENIRIFSFKIIVWFNGTKNIRDRLLLTNTKNIIHHVQRCYRYTKILELK